MDPDDLAEAVKDQALQERLDFRTRLLIRDSVEALRHHWGPARLASWLERCPARERIAAILDEELGEPGFGSLRSRIMEKTRPEEVEQYLRELGMLLPRPIQLFIGGSIALILPGYLARATEDIDVVDEVPQELRRLHPTLEQMKSRFGLELAHFQSHYLPMGWRNRVHSSGPYGRLQVYLLDVHDVFLSKLFSIRTKDRDDLRLLAPQLDKQTLARKLLETTGSMLSEPSLRQRAADNWYILYGEALPS